MWWIRLNCILLTSLAILSATKAVSTRDKRDLSYVKNFIKTAIFGRENKPNPELVLVSSGENYKIFRIPGFNNVLVKAVPKVSGAEKSELVSPEDSKVGIVASYLGTKTQGETLTALQRVKTLLGSGILTATKDQGVPVGLLPPHRQLIAVGEGTFEKPHILLDTSTTCDDVQADERPLVVQQPTIWQSHPFLSIFQRPIPFPTILKPMSPVKVPVPALSTKYSYKQFHGDGKGTIYTANDDQNVMVTQYDQSGTVPPFVTYRIQEAIKLGSHGMQGLFNIPVFAGNIQRPIQYFTSPKVNPNRPIVSAVGNNYSYKQIHNDGTFTSYSSGQKGGDVVVTEGGRVPPIPTFITDRIEKVAATAATGKQPNPMVLSGLNVAQAQWYNPLVYGHQMVDTKGGVQVTIDTTGQQQTHQNQHANTGSQGTYFYQTIHKDGSVTNYGVDSSSSSTPAKAEMKPISPLFIEDRLQTIAKTNGGSFSYKILHNDGSVTNYGEFGVHEEKNGGSKIVPIQKTKPETNKQSNFISGNTGPASQLEIKDKGSAGLLYKTIHSDGSVTSYSSNGVVEDGKGPANQFRGDNMHMTNNLHINLPNRNNAGTFSYEMQQKSGKHVSNAAIGAANQHTSGDSKVSELPFHQNKIKAPQTGNTYPGSYTYKAVHSDGSVTIYSQNGVKEINDQQKFTDQNKLQQSVSALGTSDQDEKNIQENAQNNAGLTLNNQDLKQNGQVSTHNNAVPSSASFSYRAIHNDGSATIYSQNGVKEESAPLNNENQPSSSAISVNQNNQNKENNKFFEGSVQNNDLNNKTEKQNIHVSSQSNVGSGSGTFSYKAIHNDGSATIYSQNGVKQENKPLNSETQQSSSDAGVNNQVKSQNIQPSTQNNAIEDQAVKQNIPGTSQNNAALGSFFYKTVHNDGLMAIYSQNGVKEEKVALPNKNQQSSGSRILQQQENSQKNVHVNAQNVVIPVPGSFSYKAVHNDGSTTIYLQNGVKEENVPLKNKSLQSTSAADVNQQNVHVNAKNIVVPASGSFSYKVVHNDGSMTTYSQSGVKKETNEKESHIEENRNYSQYTNIPIYQVQQSINDMKINMNEQLLHTNQQKKDASSHSSFSYKAVHSDGSQTTYSGQGVEEVKASSPVNAPNQQNLSNKQDDVSEEINVHTNPQHNGKPSGSFSYKSIHSDGSVSNMQSGASQQSDRDQSSAAFEDEHKTNQVIPSAPKLPELSNNDFSVTPVGVLVADSKNVLFTKPVVSSYSYKQINHHSPDQFNVEVNIGNVASTESKFSAHAAAGVSTNEATTVDIIPNDYVNIPPANVNEPLPIKAFVPKEETSTRKQNHPSVVVFTPVEVVPCVEKSLAEHPIVVLDEPMKYSYQHRKADGSAIHVKSDQSVVSVSISPNERVRNRGDIPESP